MRQQPYMHGSEAINLALLEHPEPPTLTLVPSLHEETSVIPQFVSADILPLLSLRRQHAAQEFATILGQNRRLLYAGETDKVPLPVDALGTARQVIAIGRKYGKESTEYQEVRDGLILDSSRLLHEAVSKNNPEYFAEILQTFDSKDGGYYSHGLAISPILVNGISPLAHHEEIGRRGKELGEERTYEAVGEIISRFGIQRAIKKLDLASKLRLEKPADATSLDITTISECADYAIEGYKINPNGSHGGYAPAINKFMIRRVHFRDDSGNRYTEQAAIDGRFMDHELIVEVLAEAGGLDPMQDIGKTDLLGTQFMGVDNGGVHELVMKLDRRAGEKHGKNLFYGKQVPADHPKDYGDFEKQALMRQKKLEPMPTQLADMLIGLAEAGTDPETATGMTDRFLKVKLLELAERRPELAESIFDKATAEGFAEVARLEKEGKFAEAAALRADVKDKAPEISYCGAGSNCGVENVDPGSAAYKIAMNLGLSGEIVHNTSNPCTDCGAMELHHDMHGNSACVACGSKKLMGQEVEHGSAKKVD